MIHVITRATKLCLKYSNTGKKEQIVNYLFNDLFSEQIIELTTDLLYSNKKIHANPPKEIYEKLPFRSARLNQRIGSEICACVNSIKNKIKKINTEGNMSKYQKEIVDKFSSHALNVPMYGHVNLDNRFVTIEKNEQSQLFDYWIHIHLPRAEGVKDARIPIKTTRHMRKLEERGYSLKTNVLHLKRNGDIELIYEMAMPSHKSEGREIGLDTGRNKAFVCSDGVVENVSKSVLNTLRQKKHGSKRKAGQVSRLHQIIDKEIKDKIDFSTIKLIVMENLDGMKPGKRWGNTNHHWSYRYIQKRIAQHCEEHGVRVIYVAPAYTSQTCSACGHKHKNNRHGEEFLCLRCGMEMDADLNASINILRRGHHSPLYLKEISL